MKLIYKMASVMLLVLLFLSVIQVNGQTQKELRGAWANIANDKTVMLLFQDGYFTQSIYQAGKYVKSLGGPYTVKNGEVTVKLEFDSEINHMVGSNLTADFSVEGNNLNFTIISNANQTLFNLSELIMETHHLQAYGI